MSCKMLTFSKCLGLSTFMDRGKIMKAVYRQIRGVAHDKVHCFPNTDCIPDFKRRTGSRGRGLVQRGVSGRRARLSAHPPACISAFISLYQCQRSGKESHRDFSFCSRNGLGLAQSSVVSSHRTCKTCQWCA